MSIVDKDKRRKMKDSVQEENESMSNGSLIKLRKVNSRGSISPNDPSVDPT